VKQLFDELIEGAYTNGEPGVAFVDAWNKANPLPDLGPLASTNPCGEQTLHPYDNCNLGSINLASFVKDGQIEWERLRFVTRTATRLMDNVVDIFDFPVQEVTDMAKKNRRIGLGIMGFGDMLYQLNIRYDSQEGFDTAERVMGFINEEAYNMSQELAEEKGEFPNYPKSVFAKQTVHSEAQSHGIGKKMRNAALTTVAPTGSISMMLDCSSGVEPNFALAYIKQDKDGMQYQYLNTYFEQALNDLSLSADEIEDVKKEVIEKGTIQHLSNLPQELRETFIVAMDISGRGHMQMQAAFQKHVDNSISKTINLPNEATREDVGEGFIDAWKLGCKSCTVYREGSRVIQILNVGNGDNIVSPTESPVSAEKSENVQTEQPAQHSKSNGLKPRPRPEVMAGKTYRIKTGYGNLYVTINDDERGRPFEVFTIIGKNGGFMQEQSEAICRLISLALRAGVSTHRVVDDLKGIRGPMPIFTDKGTILSLPDAIGRILEEHIAEQTDTVEELVAQTEAHLEEEVAVLSEAQTASVADFGFMPGCPECDDVLIMQEGCMACKSCGYSRCS
jgi:ribonucleoside-diphosphate reductase alpha chain